MKVIFVLFLIKLIVCENADSVITNSPSKAKYSGISALKKVILPDMCASMTNCSSIMYL